MIDHIGFALADAERSRLFHKVALAPPGINSPMIAAPRSRPARKAMARPHCGPIYYRAFGHDPDGNNIEAVCRAIS